MKTNISTRTRRFISTITTLFFLTICILYSPPGRSHSNKLPDSDKALNSAEKMAGVRLYIKNACASCHGPDGKQPVFSHYPSLAGQTKNYLIQQFQNIAQGKRNNNYAAQMQLVVNELKLSHSDINHIFSWLETLTIEPKKKLATSTAALAYRQRGCGACHGKSGNQSVLMNAPKLAGNNADYLFNQLLSYQTGERSNNIMSNVVKQIPEQELKDIAQWLSY